MNIGNNELKIKLNGSIYGYKVKQILELTEIDSIFYLLRHKKTGAQHIHIENDDKENTFGVAFKTIPSNSTGIAHVLEHTVLCGSLNFPVRDPFFSMLKRSLSTFMNAFTSSDWTMYPFSTQNKKDYYNLMSVYMDSVLFPKIDELSFKQEGCRIDFEDPTTKETLVYKGIVYNEMKGVMSSPDQIMVRSILNALYPDTTYANNSGGDPLEIPYLTHKALKQFHKKYYHPSNSFFYTYGDLELDLHLEYLDKNFLSRFSRIHPDTNVPSQLRWKKPKTLYYYYPLSENKEYKKKNQVCLAWLMADIKNTFDVLVLSILEQILLGNAASPLRKALIDSNIGSSLSDGTGFDAENRDTMFACGLKDVEEADAEKIKKIILEKLDELVEEGIEQSLIDSVLHQIEFSRRERTNSPYPFGIKLLMGISACWLHGGNPGDVLQIDKDIIRIKKEILNGGFFEKKIKEYFVKNKHRVLFIFKPDQKMEENENKRVKNELLKIRSNMSESDLEIIKSDTRKLDDLRQKNEDLSCLPTLQLEDIPKYITTIKSPVHISDMYDLLLYEQPTSGILYFSGLVGVGSLEKNILPLVPFFCHAFSRLGTKLSNYTKIAHEIDLYTGGISLTPHPRTMFNTNGVCVPFIALNSKCLIRNKDKMIEIIQEMVSKINFNDYNRIIQLLQEYKAGIESMTVRNGHNLAISLSSRNFSNANYLNEMWSGVSQFHTIQEILEQISKDNMESIVGKLQNISSSIFSKDNIKLAIIGEQQDLILVRKNIGNFINSISSDRKTGFQSIDFNLGNKYFCEGWATSTSVSFVAQTFETVKMEHKDSPALSVISKIIRSMYLHKEIREKGGAYGGFAIYNSENGLFSFCSYRDPHIIKTLDTYDGSGRFISSNNLRYEDIKEAILQVCAEIDRPDSPSTAAKKDFLRRTIGLSNNVRQKYKERLLSLNKNDVIEVADKYFNCDYLNKSIAIVSNEKLLQKAGRDLSNLNLNIRSI